MKVVAHHSFPTEKANNRMKYSVIGVFFSSSTNNDTIQRQPKRGQGSFLFCWLFFMEWHNGTQQQQTFFFNNNKRQQWNQEERKGSKYICSKFSHYFISSLSHTSHTHISHHQHQHDYPVLFPIHSIRSKRSSKWGTNDSRVDHYFLRCIDFLFFRMKGGGKKGRKKETERKSNWMREARYDGQASK